MKSTWFMRLFGAFVLLILLVVEISAQSDAVVVEWGDRMENPEFGFNARLRTQHQLPFCEQPAPSDFEFDWNNSILRERIVDMNPGILRFPGGTPANFWIWEDEVMEVYNSDGTTELLSLCEGSVIGRTYSADIGCSGVAEVMDYEAMSQIYSNTTVTLSSYIEAIDDLRAKGVEVSEMFVLGVFDPRYYVGSPQLEFETSGWQNGGKRNRMKTRGRQRAESQLDKILYEYCGDCDFYEGELSFELGNEVHLRRFGKFMPSLECFDVNDICEECLPDVDWYADLCEQVIPIIREKFPNSKIAVNGSRDLAGEPWNQVIIDRFGSGQFQADAAMMHFYPKSTNPDSLSMDLCLDVEGSFDSEKVLHYQQVFTDFLFEQRNVDLFKETDMELWFTEFNNYDYSELCSRTFGITYEDDQHLYDSGNWLHALNVMNLFNKFSHYKCSNTGPWSDVDHGNNITKLCFHLMLGQEREAALRADMDYSAAGLAITSLMDAIQATDSFNLLLISPPEALNIDDSGGWTPVDEDAGIPWMYDLEYSDKNGNRLTTETWDSFGWTFRSDENEKAIIVNLKGSSMNLDISNLPGHGGDTYFKTYKVPKNKLGQTLLDGERSNGLFINEGVTDGNNILIPPFSFSILKMDFEFPLPENNGCASSVSIVPTLWELDNWRRFMYSGAGGYRPSCLDGEQVKDIWFDFIPDSRDEVIMVRDVNDRLDLVIEVMDGCTGESIGCLDAYGVGEAELGFIDDLSIGEQYKFRVHAKNPDPLDINFIEVQVKTMTTAGIVEVYCENLGLDEDDQITAVAPYQIYEEDPGVDAYRFKFIPEAGGPALVHKNEVFPPYSLPISEVEGLQTGENYIVKVQHRITTEANGETVKLWSEVDEGCRVGIDNNCTAFFSPPVGLSKSSEPVNGLIDRIQLKWYKELPEIPYSIADSAACDIEFWPVKDLVTNTPILNGTVKTIGQKSKPGQPFFKWPIKFSRQSIVPNRSYKWRIRCACEYGNGPMSPWSEEKFFNTPDFDPLTNIYTPQGNVIGAGASKSHDWIKLSEQDFKSNTLTFKTSIDLEREASLEVFDITGTQVLNLDFSTLTNHSFVLRWHTSPNAGIYFVRLTQGDVVLTSRHFIGG